MLAQIVVISLIVLAVYATMIKGNIFSFIRRLGDRYAPEWVQKIVYDCYICMCAYYGSIAYYLLFRNSIKDWIVTIICAMGLNTFVYFVSNKD